jgi:hypothetical protein
MTTIKPATQLIQMFIMRYHDGNGSIQLLSFNYKLN